MLRSLDRLSGVATNVINRSREDVLADLELLRPVLRNLADSGQDLPNSLQLLLTIPFTDAATDAVAGDYTNLYVTADLDIGRHPEQHPGQQPDAAGEQPAGPAAAAERPVARAAARGERRAADAGAGRTARRRAGARRPAPAAPAPAAPGPGARQAPATPTPEPTRGGGLFGGLLGGGS